MNHRADILPLALLGWTLLNGDHNHSVESTGLDPSTTLGGLVIVILGTLAWYTYIHYIK